MINKQQQFDEAIRSLKSEAFTDSEKSTMRDALLTHAKNNPHSKGGLVQSPYSWMTLLRKPVVVMAIVLVFSTSGVAYAAEGALPGEALYGFKRNINEPIRGALAFGVDAEIAWQEELALRRLDEAIALQEQGELSQGQQIKLESDYTSHIDKRTEKREQQNKEASAKEREVFMQKDLEFSDRIEAKAIILGDNLLLDINSSVQTESTASLQPTDNDQQESESVEVGDSDSAQNNKEKEKEDDQENSPTNKVDADLPESDIEVKIDPKLEIMQENALESGLPESSDLGL